MNKAALKKPRRATDVNVRAHQLIRESTADPTSENGAVTDSEVSRVMAAMGRKGGKIGGKKRAASLSPARRQEIALKAARSRWDTQPAKR